MSHPLWAGMAGWAAGTLLCWATLATGAAVLGDSSRSIKLPASDVVRAVSEGP